MIIITIAYFGKLPNYFDIWKQTLFNNEGVLKVLLITDQEVKSEKNLYVFKCKIEDVRLRLFNFLKKYIDCGKINKSNLIKSHYKLCDVKVVYPILFKKEIEEIATAKKYHTGYGDLDVIYGNFKSFYNKSINKNLLPLKKYEVIGIHGHLTVIENNSKIWKKMLEGKMLSRIISSMLNVKHSALDEGYFRRFLMKHLGVNVGPEILDDSIWFSNIKNKYATLGNERWQMHGKKCFESSKICNLEGVIQQVKQKYGIASAKNNCKNYKHKFLLKNGKILHNGKSLLYVHMLKLKNLNKIEKKSNIILTYNDKP